MSEARRDRLGSRLGDYRIRGKLGSGAMGDVYRARDDRLDRDVALKILPETFASDLGRVRRFETEARLASALNHPNIVTIYSVGAVDSVSFIAMELVEGRSLREAMAAAPFSVKKLLDIAFQLATGLARAHEAGIVHRDLKPENVMITRDGIVKILDFGLSKRMPFEGEAGSMKSTLTQEGAVIGTVGYMSPEQAAGEAVDFRSDQFSFGAILYEMATGKRAFQGKSAVETLASIIRDEPEPVARANPRVPAPLRWLVERCLAKEPSARYAATEDLARELETLGEHVPGLSGKGTLFPGPRRRARSRTIGLAVVTVAAMAGGYFLGRRVERTRVSSPRFQQLTFRNAGISSARFAPDGQTVVYTAQWEGKLPELFTTRIDSPETRSLGLPSAEILSISSSGRMALLLTPPRLGALFRLPHSDVPSRFFPGVLAEAPFAGGAPRELLDNVWSADLSPAGDVFAVSHEIGGKNRLEFPAGRVLYEKSTGVLAFRPSISPSGDRVAFVNLGNLFVTGADGQVLDLRERALEALWSRATNEIWFNSVARGTTDLFAVFPGHAKRRVTTFPGDFVLHDLSGDGRVLLGRVSESSEILGDFPGEARPRNLSHFDRSLGAALAPGGDTLLFNEAGQGGHSVYLRRTDGSPPKRLADGWGWALSRDGKFVLAGGLPYPSILLIPTGPGPSRPIDTPGLKPGGRMGFFPDGRRIWFLAEHPVQGRRAWVQDLDGGNPRPVTPPDVVTPVLSDDGRFLCARDADGDWYLHSTDTSESHKVVGLREGEDPIQWTPDGRLYVRSADEHRPDESPVITRIYRHDPLTGRRELWKEIPAVNPSAGGAIDNIFFSADGKTCVYTHHRYSSELFVVDGLR